MITEAKFIGNVKSKEFHRPDCFTIKNLYNINQIPLFSEKQAISNGYDPCGHCLYTIREKREVTDTKDYFYGHIYGIFNGLSTDDYTGIDVNYGSEITVFVKLQKVVFEDGNWIIYPISNHSIDISCDFIDFPSQKTNSEGLATWKYMIPDDFEPGITDMLADPHIAENLVWNNNSNSIFFNVPQQIEILENIPNDFDQETSIVFKLAIDKRIKADIYRGSAENEFSHINNLRDFGDGVMNANDKAALKWDGTIDHGLRKGKPVMSGKYKIVIRGEHGISDRDELYLNKKEGVLGGVDPEPNEPNEYISEIGFSRNPFSAETKVALNFNLQKSAKVSIHIQHINWNFIDKCVREIIHNKYLEKGNHSYIWDGKNNFDTQATLGEYKVRILANEEPFVEKGLWKKANWNLLRRKK